MGIPFITVCPECDKNIYEVTLPGYCLCNRANKQLTAKDARIAELIQNIRDMKYWAESGYPTQTIKIADEALQHKEQDYGNNINKRCFSFGECIFGRTQFQIIH